MIIDKALRELSDPKLQVEALKEQFYHERASWLGYKALRPADDRSIAVAEWNAETALGMVDHVLDLYNTLIPPNIETGQE